MSRACTRCGKQKDQSEFTRGKVACRDCRLVESRRWRDNNRDQVRRAAVESYHASDWRRIYLRHYQRSIDKEKVFARKSVQDMVRAGKIVRAGTCEGCGEYSEKRQAHHEDYSKPLEVKMLCTLCHGLTRRRTVEVPGEYARRRVVA